MIIAIILIVIVVIIIGLLISVSNNIEKAKIKTIEFLESWAYYNSKYISLISW